MVVKIQQGPDGRIYLADGVRRGAPLSYEQVVNSGIKLTEIKGFDAEKFNLAYKPNMFSEKTQPLYVAQIDEQKLRQVISFIEFLESDVTVHYIQSITEPHRTDIGITAGLVGDTWEFSVVRVNTGRHFHELNEALIYLTDQILGGGK